MVSFEVQVYFEEPYATILLQQTISESNIFGRRALCGVLFIPSYGWNYFLAYGYVARHITEHYKPITFK
jgi:hypothetical protein